MADKEINTNGGTFIGEDVSTSGCDFIGRDRINSTTNTGNTITTLSTHFSGNFLIAVIAVLVVGIISIIAILRDRSVDNTGTLTALASSHSTSQNPTIAPVVDIGLAIKQILLSTKPQSFLLEIITSNPHDRDILVSQISVGLINWTGCEMSCLTCSHRTITIDGSIGVISVNEARTSFRGQFVREENFNQKYPFQGMWYEACSMDLPGSLDLVLETSILLHTDSITNIIVELPSMFSGRKEVFTLANRGTMGSDENIDELNLESILAQPREICVGLNDNITRAKYADQSNTSTMKNTPEAIQNASRCVIR